MNTYIKKFNKLAIILIALFTIGISDGYSKKKEEVKETGNKVNSSTFSGLKLRSIGPSFTSGRVADFAVNPNNYSEFYVGIASGNIWKTTNNGQTFNPVFENYGAYSIGCLAMDPNNHNVVWAGTGENNHQRALGYGDGVYKTVDGGKTWKNMGLKESRQIGGIVIDPRNSNIVFVAAEGSAWGPGGDRGLYKTSDGGKTWKKVLDISENTGINNVLTDPRNPDIMYASSEQRRRHVFTKIGGGPETAIYKSEDGGENWRKLESGLPKDHMGGMGLAISPQNPDVLYAIIEAANNTGGFFRSEDRGESWKKMSDYSSSGQYYNEIFCDPVEFDKVYSVETVSRVTKDGGKKWTRLGLKDRHVDDHALWINPDNNKHWMIGGDGGVYITYDDGDNFFHVTQLPVIQFYRVTVDNEEPFYNVYGGTQDNATLGGPSRNLRSFGVTNPEWIVTVFGDGFWSRVDPTDPNIVYSEWQYGNVVRYDKKSGEKISIKPQPGKNEESYKWNWNAPLIISPHSNTRLYMAANKLFRSDDRGNTWSVISDDLTAQIDRNTWPVMGKYWSADAVVKDVSTSQFGMVVSLDESRIKENLIYTGTDDGVIQITENAGESWNKISSFPGVPSYTYVSDIFASKHDENIVYASFDNRKRDDFKPYILKSSDKGKTWVSISNDLPVNGTVHTIEQDHVNPNLLFAGTEFGIFFSYNGGINWVQLKSGIPTIAVRDLAIQERENDLVLATFGRGFYILDDYTPLREFKPETLDQDAELFTIKDALLFIQTNKIYGQGATYWGAKNPDFGATFSLYLNDIPKTAKQLRQEKEKELFKTGKPIPQPTWKELEDEGKEIKPYLIFTIFDENDHVIRKINHKPKKGLQRYLWDLKYESPYPVSNRTDKFDPFKTRNGGVFVLPGSYKISVNLISSAENKELISKQDFEVKSLNNTTLPAPNRAEMVEFQREVSTYARTMIGSINLTNELQKKLIVLKQTALTTSNVPEEFMDQIISVEKEIDDILFIFNGVKAKASWEEIPPAQMPLYRRLRTVINTQINSTSGITETSKMTFEIIKEEFPPLLERISKIATVDLINIEQELEKLGGTWTPGRVPRLK